MTLSQTGPRGFRDEIRAMGRLAVPVVAIQVGWMAMGVVDTVVVGRVSADAMAAVALGNLLFLAIAIFGMGVLMGLDPVVAQAVGAGDQRAVARAVQRGLVLIGGLTLVCSLALLPARAFLTAAGQPARIIPTAAAYTRIALAGFLPFFVVVLVRVVLQATGSVASMVWATLAANVLNALLNWILVFGRLGMAPHGAIGSSWATTLSRWTLALFMIVFAWPRLRPYVTLLTRDAIALVPLRRILALGGPIGIQYELELGIFSLVGLMMGRLGAVPMAAHQVALNLASITFMVPLGVSIAASVLVGHAVGRGDVSEARRAAAAGLICGVGFMAVSGAAMLCFPRFLAHAYTTDSAVIGIAITLIPLAGVFQVFDGTQVVSIGILRGTGDTRTPMVVNILGYWVIGLPLAAYLGLRTSAGPAGMWWGLVAGLAIVAVILLARVRSRLRGTLTRLALEAPLPSTAEGVTPG
jgi:MATE family, multidrug efflux pump